MGELNLRPQLRIFLKPIQMAVRERELIAQISPASLYMLRTLTILQPYSNAVRRNIHASTLLNTNNNRFLSESEN
jgi:hypothetical protein